MLIYIIQYILLKGYLLKFTLGSQPIPSSSNLLSPLYFIYIEAFTYS